ncbi:hypothetical protein ES703_30488 [subsurface metagenome]
MGGHHTRCVTGQEDDVFRVGIGHPLGHGVGDELQRIGSAGVLGQDVIIQVNPAGGRIIDHIFQYGTEFPGAGVYLWFIFGGEADDLGVAAGFEIEHAGGTPAVLVITDQPSFGIGGQGGLARTAEPEENGHVPIITHVSRAVHGKHVLKGQEEVQHREDGLLDLAAIEGIGDDSHSLGKIEHDGGRAAGAVNLGIGFEARDDDEGKIGDKVLELVLVIDGDEHVPGEQAEPCLFRNDPHLQAVFGIGPGIAVLHEELLVLGEGLYAGE